MEIPEALRPVAEWQAWVVTRGQCDLAGVGRAVIRTLVSSGRWQRVHRGIYVTHSGPLAPHTRIWIAILACGPDAMASHETALWTHRPWIGQLPSPIQIAVPDGTDARNPPAGVAVHRLTGLVPDSEHMLPRMPGARAVLEIAHRALRPERVIEVVCQAVGSRIVTAEEVLAELRVRKRQRWRRLLLDLLVDVAVGAQSPLELKDLANDRAHGLPWQSRQVTTRVDGAQKWLDVKVTIPETGAEVIKELDGRLNHEGTAKSRDYRRDNAATLRGQASLRFGWPDLTGVPCEVAAAFYFVLLRHGWTGMPTACGPRCSFAANLRSLVREHAA